MVETAGERVAELIVEQARQWPADVIVMGTHGRRGFNHLLMGSDAEAVIRLSPVPVLLVKQDQAPS
jgi:nucleotide-binding universal stress UspA family protein